MHDAFSSSGKVSWVLMGQGSGEELRSICTNFHNQTTAEVSAQSSVSVPPFSRIAVGR
jgi:hypothetical protein